MLLAYGIQQYAGWDVAFSFPALIIAPLAAIVTGVLFGLHPAMRAAAFDPAVALRES
jgi:ABC-type lipoprotein release transport system permease subunit